MIAWRLPAAFTGTAQVGTFPFLGINIASDPFRRERARLAAMGTACVLLACSFLATSVFAVYRYSDARRVHLQTESDWKRLASLQAEQTRYSRILSQSQDSDVFSWSVFYNQIIARRGVSWSRVFEDLASVMPSHMRLIGIRSPQVKAEEGGTNRVQLDLVVGSDQPGVVIDFLKNLQQSNLFGPAKVMSRTPPAEHDPEYKFRVLVAYAQNF